MASEVRQLFARMDAQQGLTGLAWVVFCGVTIWVGVTVQQMSITLAGMQQELRHHSRLLGERADSETVQELRAEVLRLRTRISALERSPPR